MNVQGWFLLGLADLISLGSKGLSRNFSTTKIRKHQFFSAQSSLWFNFHNHTWILEKKHIVLTIQAFLGKVMSLLLNRLSGFVIVFLPSNKHLLISWLQSLSIVILEAKKITSVTAYNFSPSIFHEMMGPDDMILVFGMLSLKQVLSLFSFTLIKRVFCSSSLSAIRVVTT